MPKPPLIRNAARREFVLALLMGLVLVGGLVLAWLVTGARPF